MAEKIKTFGYVLMLLGAWGLMTERDLEDKQQAQTEYVRGLEQTLAKCLSPTDQPIIIGGELHFCSTTRTGITL